MTEPRPITTISTSRRTAETDDIVLRVTDTTRLLFRPLLLENPNDPAAAVKGDFIFQRKTSRGTWEDHKQLNLSQLKATEWVKLELHSDELLKLVTDLRALYDLVADRGIGIGRQEYVPAPKNTYLRELLADVETRDALFSDEGASLLKGLIEWLPRRRDDETARLLAELDESDLNSFEVIVGYARLKRFLRAYQENKNDADERFWQRLLTEQGWVLSQLFASPFVVFHDQVYVGGKTIDNTGGNLADFLYRNVAVIEIKTPATRLVGDEYRNNVYPMTAELSGGVVQVLNNRDSLVENFKSLFPDAGTQMLRPKALLVAGSIEGEGLTDSRLRSFEQFRNGLRDVDVVPFDELASKAESFLDLLVAAPAHEDVPNEEFPF
jgi:hypothetical protein